VIGCGALAPELVELTRRAGLPAMDLTCLPASLHNRPERIPGAVQARIRRARREGYDRIFVAYADCGTGGLLDNVLDAEGVARLAGAHCYEVYAGRAAFAALHDQEPGTFYLTDYLVRNFDRLVIRGLGLDRHPELRQVYFGNYHRLVYLAQADDADLTARAEAAAERLGLAFERLLVGLGELGPAIAGFARVAATDAATERSVYSRTTPATSSATPNPPMPPDIDSAMRQAHERTRQLVAQRLVKVDAHQMPALRRQAHQTAPLDGASGPIHEPGPSGRGERPRARGERPRARVERPGPRDERPRARARWPRPWAERDQAGAARVAG
jgi:hypothetical protein